MDIIAVAEVERQYPDEWVVLEIIRDHKHHSRVARRLIAHGQDRAVLDKPYRRFRAEHPRAQLYEFYTGDVVANGAIAIPHAYEGVERRISSPTMDLRTGRCSSMISQT